MTVSVHDRADAGRQRVVLERAFTAPRELVFSLFLDPAHLVRWWCPYPLTFPVCEFDARPGGAIHLVLQTSDGKRFPSIGTVLEVDPPKRLVFSTRRETVEPGSTQMEVLQTITFMERDDQTVIRVQIDVVQANETTPQTLAGMEIGWMQDFGRLEFYLLPRTDAGGVKRADADDGAKAVIRTPSDREIVVARTFNAPRSQIFKAITDPTTIPNWWGPRHMTTTVETMNVRPQGEWRFLQHRPDGGAREFRGEYFLIEPPELVVSSFEFDPQEEKTEFNQIEIDAVHLLERNGTTLLTNVALYPSKAKRDSALDSGAARQTIESYERLEDLLLALV
jgi:uncharacterized protein YndB with AHSA1/START domain